MKSKYVRMKHANNDFTAFTGVRAFQMKGGSGCLIVQDLTIKGLPVGRYAYHLYTTEIAKYLANPEIKVSHTCGVDNCVKKEHLKARYEPTKKNDEYIRAYVSVDSVEDLAERMNVPMELFLERYPVRKRQTQG